jgi:hypothetical protein
MELEALVRDFARGMRLADARKPQAANARTRSHFKPGLGPHSEGQTIDLVLRELASTLPAVYGSDVVHREVPYPAAPRSGCDLCLGRDPDWEWAIELKMLRLMGDNGQPNDNMLMHILSPYPANRSAVTDGLKLVQSGLSGRKGIIIFGYEYPDWPMEPVIRSFEVLLAQSVDLSPRVAANLDGLIHPVHNNGSVLGGNCDIGLELR